MASRTTTDPIEILLEMGVDLDNLSEEEDYLSALMEAVNTLQIKDAGDPRIGFLADEIRKVRQKRKAADPKFKAKKTKISADSFKKGSATTASIGQRSITTCYKTKDINHTICRNLMRLMMKRKVVKRKKQEQERKQIRIKSYLRELQRVSVTLLIF